MEEWAFSTWRLKGVVLISPLNKDLMLFEFTFLEDARRVFEGGPRCFKGGMLLLDLRNSELECVKKGDLGKNV